MYDVIYIKLYRQTQSVMLEVRVVVILGDVVNRRGDRGASKVLGMFSFLNLVVVIWVFLVWKIHLTAYL